MSRVPPVGVASPTGDIRKRQDIAPTDGSRSLIPEPKNRFFLSLGSNNNTYHLTFTIVDPIFSDRQQQTFTDLFWLSNSLGEHIVETWSRLTPSSLSNPQLQQERSL